MSDSNFKHKQKSQSISDLNQIAPKNTFSTLISKPCKKLFENSAKTLRDSGKILMIKNILVRSPVRAFSFHCKPKKNFNDSSFFSSFFIDDSIDVSSASEAQKTQVNESCYKSQLKYTFDNLKIIKSLQKYFESIKQSGRPVPVLFPSRKLLVFDLDETLIHCMGLQKGQVCVKLEFPDGEKTELGVNLRPFVKELLEFAVEFFEVAIFTASHKFYADAVIDVLEREQKYFHHRLYREDCVKVKNFNIKDLRIFNRKTEEIIIIDNSVISFALSLDNGVPITTWVNNPFDLELRQLIEYLKEVINLSDVKSFNRELFRLDEFYEDYSEEFEGKKL